MFTIEERGRDLSAEAERLDLEGSVAKRKAGYLSIGDRVVLDQDPDVYAGEGRRELSGACLMPSAPIHWSSLFLLGFATAFQYLRQPSSVHGTGT